MTTTAARKRTAHARRTKAAVAIDPEEIGLAKLNRLLVRAAPRMARENASALKRYQQKIAAEIRRAG